MDKYYYIRFVADGVLCNGVKYRIKNLPDEHMDNHILGFLENHPGELYDVVTTNSPEQTPIYCDPLEF